MSLTLALRSRALLLLASGIAAASLTGCSVLGAAATPTASPAATVPASSATPGAAGTSVPPTASIPGSAASGDPGSGVVSKTPGPTTGGPFDDGATLVKPDPKIVDLHGQSWDHVAVSANGKTLTVYFWMGVQSCYGLGKVDVSTVNGVLSIRLFTGVQPGQVGKACVDMAQLYKTIVHLQQPLIRGGAA